MENLPKLSKEQIAELDLIISKTQNNNMENVAFPHVVAGLAGLAAAGITAALVARDIGAKKLDFDITSEADLKKFLKSQQEAGLTKDIPLSKLIKLRNMIK